MKRGTVFLLIAVFSTFSSFVQGQSLIRKVVSTNGGNQSANGVSLSWTMGETVIPTLIAGNNLLTQGFEQSESAIQTVLVSPNPLCAGNMVIVSFNASGIIGSGNIFTAELSDQNGNFYSPVIIGTGEGNSSGTINAVVPQNTAAGTHYRIRVLADKPKVTGRDNGIDIIIQQLTTWYLDADGDHYYSGEGVVQCTSPGTGYSSAEVTGGNDCNDANHLVNPGMIDVCNGIDDNCDAVVDENKIVAAITPLRKQDGCEGADIVLAANNGAGILYHWKKDNVEIPGASNRYFRAKEAGSYTVDETNNFGCNATAEPFTIGINPAHVVKVTTQGSLDICVTGSVVLKANGGNGFSYQWRKGTENIEGATNKNYTATIAGKYKVEITYAYNCTMTSMPIEVVKSCKLDESTIETEQAKLLVYPNPTNGAFVIELHDATKISAPVEIQLLNLLGQSVYQNQIQMSNGMLQQEVKFNATLSAGAYLVKVTVNDKVYVEELVYQH